MRNSFSIVIKFFIIIAISIVIINDAIRVAMPRFQTSLADEIAQEGMKNYLSTHSPSAAEYTSQSKAKEMGVTLNKFNFSPEKITVEVIIPVRDTFIVHRIGYFQPYLKVSVTGSATPSYE